MQASASRRGVLPLWLSSLLACLAVTAAGCDRDSPPPAQCGSALATEVLVTPVAEPPADPSEVQRLVGQCVERVPDRLEDESSACVVLERSGESECDCAIPGRQPVSELHAPLVDDAKARSDVPEGGCYCEVVPLTGDEALLCRQDESEPVLSGGEPLQGFCVVDELDGNESVLGRCPGLDVAAVRFAGDVQELRGHTFFITCATTICE